MRGLGSPGWKAAFAEVAAIAQGLEILKNSWPTVNPSGHVIYMEDSAEMRGGGSTTGPAGKPVTPHYDEAEAQGGVAGPSCRRGTFRLRARFCRSRLI